MYAHQRRRLPGITWRVPRIGRGALRRLGINSLVKEQSVVEVNAVRPPWDHSMRANLWADRLNSTHVVLVHYKCEVI